MPSTQHPIGVAYTAAPVPRTADRAGRPRGAAVRRTVPTAIVGAIAALGTAAFPARTHGASMTLGAHPSPGALSRTPEPTRRPTVCVADTGVRPLGALVDRLAVQDTIAGLGVLDVGEDHGTTVAQAVVATWPWARIASVRVFEGGVAPVTVMPRAIDRCVALGADVVNLSMSGERPDDPRLVDEMRAAATRARAANVDVVLSAGNAPGPVRYPASDLSDVAVVVDATDGTRRCGFASTGPGVLVGAVGCPAWLPAADGSGWVPFSGASYAVPQVAAALAAVRAYAPGLGPDERRAALAGMPDGVLDGAELLRRIGRSELVPPPVPTAPAPTTTPVARTPTATPPATTPRVRGRWSGGRMTLRVTGVRANFRVTVRRRGSSARLVAARTRWPLPRTLARAGAVLAVRLEDRSGRRLAAATLRVPRARPARRPA